MDTKVIIVGGGPCGLMSSLLLSRYGVPNILLEKHPGTSFHPKAMGVTRRTSEIFHQQGLLKEMEKGSLPHDFSTLQLWSKGLSGEILGRAELEPDPEGITPCPRLHCPQTHSEQVLLEAVRGEKHSDIRFDCRMNDFRQSEECVEVGYMDRKNKKSHTITAEWLIAADGAASPIRRELKIETKGPGDRGHFLNVFFRADFTPYLKDRKSILYSMLGEDFAEFFVAVNGSDLWLMHHFLQPGEDPAEYDDQKFKEIIRHAVQVDVDVEVISVSPWVMSPKVAEKWRSGRIFLTGDASARLSPAGGLGMNTGLQSVQNLAWKLASVVHGLAGEKILDTYQQERMSVIGFTFEHSEGNADEVFNIIANALSGNWESAKEKIAHSRRKGSGLGLDLGLTYPAGVLVEDGTEPPQVTDRANDYVPVARPGHRAPYLKVEACPGCDSTLDWFGKGFVLVAGNQGEGWKDASATLAAFMSEGLPLHAYQLGVDFNTDSATFQKIYGIGETGAVLVRPDGYVAARWQESSGQEPELLLSTLQVLAMR